MKISLTFEDEYAYVLRGSVAPHQDRRASLPTFCKVSFLVRLLHSKGSFQIRLLHTVSIARTFEHARLGAEHHGFLGREYHLPHRRAR